MTLQQPHLLPESAENSVYARIRVRPVVDAQVKVGQTLLLYDCHLVNPSVRRGEDKARARERALLRFCLARPRQQLAVSLWHSLPDL